jgi:hypothetical protein
VVAAICEVPKGLKFIQTPEDVVTNELDSLGGFVATGIPSTTTTTLLLLHYYYYTTATTTTVQANADIDLGTPC